MQGPERISALGPRTGTALCVHGHSTEANARRVALHGDTAEANFPETISEDEECAGRVQVGDTSMGEMGSWVQDSDFEELLTV